MQIQTLQLFQQFQAATSKLNGNFKKQTRAHQVLPRYRRRRQMSYNFHRLPQFLRPRALKETGSTTLIYAPNAPKPSRKHRRATQKDKLHVFLAKRMQFKNGFPFRNTQKVLRRACQLAVLPRTDGYCVYEVSGCVGDCEIPFELHEFGGLKLFVFYKENKPEIDLFLTEQNISFKLSEYVNLVIYGDSVPLLNSIIKSKSDPSKPVFNNESDVQYANNIVPISEILTPSPIFANQSPDVQSEVNYLKQLPFNDLIQQKFLRVQKSKRVYFKPQNTLKLTKLPPQTEFEILASFKSSLSFLFLKSENAYNFLRKTTKIGVPLAGILERKFIQFESQFVDLSQNFSAGGELNFRDLCEKTLGKNQKCNLKRSERSKIREIYRQKYILTDGEDWAIQKGILDKKWKVKINVESELKSGNCGSETYLEGMRKGLDMGFVQVRDKETEVDRGYKLSAGREVYLNRGQGEKKGFII